MPSPKISVKIPKSMKVTAAEEAELKRAFSTTAIRVLRRPRTSVGAEIINVNTGNGRKIGKKKTAKKKAAKKAGKKR